jgi:L-fucose isomerase-like protein
LGARPAAFNTVRYSEKILEHYGISVDTLDLYELFGWVNALSSDDPAVQGKLQAIQDYVVTANVPTQALDKMAKFGRNLVSRWIAGCAILSSMPPPFNVGQQWKSFSGLSRVH